MATRKKCRAGHEGCKCVLSCCVLDPVRAREIAAQAGSGARWTPERGFGVSPACRCGVRKSPVTMKYGRDDGSCPAHPKEK